MKEKLLSAVIAMLFTLPLIAIGSEKGLLELRSVAEVEIERVNNKGEKERIRVDAAGAKVTPGDEVIFTTYYSNIGDKPAEGVTITSPIPEDMLYIDFSAEGEGAIIKFSVDGGKNFDFASKLKVKDSQGKMRRAGPSDYSDISWTVDREIGPDKRGNVSFRAKVK